MSDSFKYMQRKGCDKGTNLSVSARKLAAIAWEINNGFPTPNKVKQDLEQTSDIEMVSQERISKSGPVSAPQLSHPFHSPVSVSEKMVICKVDRRKADSPLQNGCLMEHGQILSKDRLKDVSSGLTISKELLQVLSRVWNVEEQKSTCLSLFSAIKAELHRACNQVSKLIHEHGYNHSEVDALLKKFEQEKAAWKMKEPEKIHKAITIVAGELKIEKKLRKQTERLNKKLGKELADTRASLSKAVKEVEGEKRAREILEKICDDLARGLGEDRAEVEELKRQSAKDREEMEMERKMLQLADVLREERVQMKLSEAKHQFEEKFAVVDKLRNELEAACLRSKKDDEQDSPDYERIKELESHLQETLPSSHIYQDKETTDGEVLDKEVDGNDDDSADSDLHSIELNMDDNSKSYQWCTVLQNDPNRFSVSDNTKKLPRQSISLERETSEGIEWEFSAGEKENVNTLDTGISNFLNNGGILDFSPQAWKKDHGDDAERYKMIKDLRDRFISASRMGSSQGLSSPTKNWSQQKLSSNDHNKVMSGGIAVLQGTT